MATIDHIKFRDVTYDITAPDRSLTSDKFTEDLQLHTLKDYVTPQMFGAKGNAWFYNSSDGKYYADSSYTVEANDDTDAIQAALDAVSWGGVVLFPKTSNEEREFKYLITRGLISSKDSIVICGQGSNGGATQIVTTQPITMLTLKGCRIKIKGLEFIGDVDSSHAGKANGIVFDRRSLGDAETYSNIDSEVKECVFFVLNDAITGVGRNLWIWDNMFTACSRGVVGILHTYGSGTRLSDFRGWRIQRNRFHGMANHNNYLSPSEAPTDISEIATWCVEMPISTSLSGTVSHIEITDNNVDDMRGAFYKGFLGGVTIKDNYLRGGNAFFVYCPISEAEEFSSGYGVIENNTCFNYKVLDDWGTSVYCEYWIYANFLNGTKISNNFVNNVRHEAIYAAKMQYVNINNNSFFDTTNSYVKDKTQRPLIHCNSCYSSSFNDNFCIVTSKTKELNYFLQIDSALCGGIFLRNNFAPSITSMCSGINPSNLMAADNEGLGWVMPELLNGFTYSNGRGYRRLFNGFVEIDLALTGGTKNAYAFQLPNGCKPINDFVIPGIAVWGDNENDAYATIPASGNVTLNWHESSTSKIVAFHIRAIFESKQV